MDRESRYHALRFDFVVWTLLPWRGDCAFQVACGYAVCLFWQPHGAQKKAWGPKTNIKKEAILSQNEDFLCFCNFPFFLVSFLEIYPLRGLPGTNPGFLETQISAKSQGLKTSWSCFVKFLKFVARSSNVVALTFRCGSR